jgi:hypothetical protein
VLCFCCDKKERKDALVGDMSVVFGCEEQVERSCGGRLQPVIDGKGKAAKAQGSELRWRKAGAIKPPTATPSQSA